MKETRVNVAQAKKQLSDLLGRVAFGKETVTITRREKPIAKLVPIVPGEGRPHVADVRGWIENRDDFFATIEGIVADRRRHPPRVLRRRK